MDEIRKKYNLSLILLHGSQVTGKLHGESDVDIAVVRKDTNNELDLLGLIFDLIKELNNKKIDIVDITNTNPLLLFAVMKNSKLLSGEVSDYEKMKLAAFHKYSDYAPYFKKEAAFIKERILSYV
jgi:uncharacterized protein